MRFLAGVAFGFTLGIAAAEWMSDRGDWNDSSHPLGPYLPRSRPG